MLILTTKLSLSVSLSLSLNLSLRSLVNNPPAPTLAGHSHKEFSVDIHSSPNLTQ